MRRGKRLLIQAFAMVAMVLSLAILVNGQAAAAPFSSDNLPLHAMVIDADGVNVAAGDTELLPGESTSITATIKGSKSASQDDTLTVTVAAGGLTIEHVSCADCLPPASTLPVISSLPAQGAYSRTITFDVITTDGTTPDDYDVTVTATETNSGSTLSGTVTLTVLDDDFDDDDVLNDVDNCPTTPNTDQADLDGDGTGDACDADVDGDGVDDVDDNCDTVANADQTDTNDDGDGDACDPNDDGDSWVDVDDNCPLVHQNDQADQDGDGHGDACDSDADGDNVDDSTDNCVGVNNPFQIDRDGDGDGDLCDADLDGDGVDNEADNCPQDSNPPADGGGHQADLDGDGVGDACDNDVDGDGVGNGSDNCPTASNADQTDTDEDGKGDACDDRPNGDDDADGIDNANDNCPTVANFDQIDENDNGIGDVCESAVSLKVSSNFPSVADTVPADSTWTLSQGEDEISSGSLGDEDTELPADIALDEGVAFGTYTLTINAGNAFKEYAAEVTFDANTESVNVQLAVVGSDVTLNVSSANPAYLNATAPGTTLVITQGETEIFSTEWENGIQLPDSFHFTVPFAYGTYHITVDAGDDFDVFSEDVFFNDDAETVDIVLNPNGDLVDQLIAILIQILDDILNG